MAKGKHSKKNTTAKTVVAASTGTVSTVVTAAVAPVIPAMTVAPIAPAKVAATTPAMKPVVTREAIAQRAFELFRARGGRHGHAMRDWLQAEAELGLGKQ